MSRSLSPQTNSHREPIPTTRNIYFGWRERQHQYPHYFRSISLDVIKLKSTRANGPVSRLEVGKNLDNAIFERLSRLLPSVPCKHLTPACAILVEKPSNDRLTAFADRYDYGRQLNCGSTVPEAGPRRSFSPSLPWPLPMYFVYRRASDETRQDW